MQVLAVQHLEHVVINIVVVHKLFSTQDGQVHLILVVIAVLLVVELVLAVHPMASTYFEM